ncbi:bifunctional phosphatase PAP2/diacylglycerol kinase family protein [Psychromicrobium lacuslunae]|uniref:PA-phosphatase n=1 Tax=Psychromicrobium lacuslunae TaxID=1618207 RepID=A0A0D4C1N8_9MICC|nr:bifunctional phosphatase PAP2/diacylglycerol kinase family protein [Psychromicrobium lacuslunae]AJT42276.1 PA-phosphatase [Psychromicrobium lacuslunae]
MRKVLRPFARADRRIVRAVSKIPAGPIDQTMRGLSAAATKGKLWFAIAGAAALVPGKPRRAALSGLLALGIASATTNLVFKTLLPRRRPAAELLPIFRFVNPQPTSSSLPSGHSASAFAFATGVATVSPTMGLALAPLAAGVAYSRVHTGAHWPSDVVIGSAIGVAAGLVVRNWFPPHEVTPETKISPITAASLEQGEGLRLVANPGSGSYTEDSIAALKRELPKLEIAELEEDKELEQVIDQALQKPGAKALAVWGGDGTVGAVAQRALAEELPLAVFPGGTFNHFARDVHSANVETVERAVQAGTALRTDIAEVSMQRAEGTETRVMLNTASVGIYPELVQRREALQQTLGKPLASIIAGLRTFAVLKPSTLKIDGKATKVWLIYLGRGRYYPRGFAPLERPVLDDGVLDIRYISARSALSRLRLLAAILTGRTEVSPVITIGTEQKLRLESVGEPFALAIDGEVIDGVHSAEFSVLPGALTVYAPPPADIE